MTTASGTMPAAQDERLLWQNLQLSLNNEQGFPAAWLALQCTMIEHVVGGCIVMLDQGQFRPVGYWPDAAGRNDALVSVCEHALNEKRGVVRSSKKNGISTLESALSAIAFPVLIEGEVVGVAGLQLRSVREHDLAVAMRKLQWGIQWVDSFYRKNQQRLEQQKHHQLALAFQLSTLCFDHASAKGAMFAIATEWAVQMQCERISIGVVGQRNTWLEAISHNANFDKKTQIARAIACAMDEAVDQKSALQYPHSETAMVMREHEKLSRMSGYSGIYTVLMTCGEKSDGAEKIFGAITIEHNDKTFFDEKNKLLCQQIALVIGPLLDIKRKENEWIGSKVVRSAQCQLQKLVGKDNYGRKLGALTAVTFVLFFMFFTSTYRVPADATVEGQVQRHVAAAIDGYITESYVTAGDVVDKGQVLFTLDNRDLKLEQIKWHGKLAQLQQQYIDALTQRNHTQVGVLQAQLDQANAQLNLIAEKLNRTQAVAPFSGVIVKGDLSQELGSPVERGQSLMQISPLDQYRIILNVDEKDISHISVGQKGDLTLSALSRNRYPFAVKKITPLSDASEGVNRFQVEAELDSKLDALRPGMQGVGKIEIGDRNLFWILTHRMFDWIRIWIWSWWP